MATRTKLTPFARLLLFLIFLVPLAYGGALYIQGKDPIAEVKGMMNGKTSSSSSKSSSTYDPQQEIEKLKKENRELKQKIKELEGSLKEESSSSTRQKWGNQIQLYSITKNLKTMTIILLAAQAGLGSFLIKVLLMALVLMGAAYLLNGVDIEDFTRAVIVAFVLAILNATLGAFLDFITTPLRWITLGLFSLVVDAVVLMIAAHFLKGFTIKSFSWALLMAIFVAVANVFLHFSQLNV